MIDVEVTATFDTMAEAEQAVSDMEEAIAKNNGELQQTTIESGEED